MINNLNEKKHLNFFLLKQKALMEVYLPNKYNNFMYGKNQSSQNHRQHGRTEQKLIQDQNYSNEIFYGLLSTLESIVMFYQGRAQEYSKKMFKAYDRVNYSSKSIQELKSQLHSQIFIFQASRKVFNQENSNEVWQLPKNFDHRQAKQFLNYAITGFRSVNDYQSQNMAKDVLSLLDGNLNNLYSEKASMKVNYSEQERKNHQRDLLKNGMMSSEEMEKRLNEANKHQSVHQLQANINENSATYAKMKNENKIQIEDSSQGGHKTHKSPSPSKKQGNPSSLERHESSEHQKTLPTYYRYAVFKHEFDAKNYLSGNFDPIYYKQVFCQYGSGEQLKRDKDKLWHNSFTYVVPVIVDHQNHIIKKEPIQYLSSLKP